MKKTVRDNGQGMLTVDCLERAAQVLRLLAHPQRLRVVEVLEKNEALPVHEIMARADLPQAVASQHLNHMRRVGLLEGLRKGREVWYRLADPRSISILECIRKHQGVIRV